MTRLSALLAILSLALCAHAATDISGRVVDSVDEGPLAGASVLIKSHEGKIKKFGTTAADGTFRLAHDGTAACRLEVAMMGYNRVSLALDSISLPVVISLTPGKTALKEVTVKSKNIREQGDTISYNVAGFAQNHDRSIGDVLARMPGIDVANSGRIKYQGEDINKFYIEGSDLLGGKYGIATNGISHEDVGAVEVMENHQQCRCCRAYLSPTKLP